ncbi:MAG: hypothetical protein LBI04_01710 [Treponema sp.]|jgi:hypothetical protein|nr:hypothetical protein [Treponema sp.]
MSKRIAALRRRDAAVTKALAEVSPLAKLLVEKLTGRQFFNVNSNSLSLSFYRRNFSKIYLNLCK